MIQDPLPSANRVGVYTLGLLADSGWTYALFVLLGAAGAVLSWPGAMLALVLPALIALLIGRLRLPERLVSAAHATGGVAGVALIVYVQCYSGFSLTGLRWLADLARQLVGFMDAGLTPPLRALVAAAFLWWRGGRLVALEPRFDPVAEHFSHGLVGLAAGFILVVLTRAFREGGAIVDASLVLPGVALFFAAGLAALAIARAGELKASLSGWTAWGRWAATVVVSILAIQAVAAGGVAVLDVQALGRVLGRLAGILGRALEWLIRLVLVPLGFLAQFLFTSTEGFWKRAVQNMAELQGLQAPPEQAPGVLADVVRPSSPVVGYIAAALLVAAAWALFRRSLRGGRRRDTQPAEERESLWSKERFREGLRAARHGLRLRRAIPLSREGYGPAVETSTPEAAIRRVYRQLLAAGRARGRPRQPDRTPMEYLTDLEGVFPGCDRELALLTAMYQRVRYGAGPATEESVAAARRLWERLAARK